jgi:hypothetical protein
MTETPPNDEMTASPALPTEAEPTHDEAVPTEAVGTEETHAVEPSSRKQDTIRDEIRAGWSRALRRG